MRSVSSSTLAAMMFGLACVACGGGEPRQAEPELVESSGDEGHVDDEPTVEEPSELPPPRSGPGQITVTNRVGGEDAGGTVQVLDGSGEVVAEGASGDTFNVRSGSYSVVGHVTDESVLIDTPTHERDGGAVVEPGETANVEVVFPRSRVLVQVRRRNRPIARWSLTVRREGRDPGNEVTLTPSRTHVPITPGRYAGTLTFGSRQIEVAGLIFQGGATMTVPVNVNE